MGVTNQHDLLPGTLDLLILRTLRRGPMHGYGIAQHLRITSLNGWVKAEWGVSDNNRRARYYTLTPAGRKRLAAERKDFAQLIGAIQRVLEA
jgi:DNA-binding PadR family transcriptional regulator